MANNEERQIEQQLNRLIGQTNRLQLNLQNSQANIQTKITTVINDIRTYNTTVNAIPRLQPGTDRTNLELSRQLSVLKHSVDRNFNSIEHNTQLLIGFSASLERLKEQNSQLRSGIQRSKLQIVRELHNAKIQRNEIKNKLRELSRLREIEDEITTWKMELNGYLEAKFSALDDTLEGISSSISSSEDEILNRLDELDNSISTNINNVLDAVAGSKTEILDLVQSVEESLLNKQEIVQTAIQESIRGSTAELLEALVAQTTTLEGNFLGVTQQLNTVLVELTGFVGEATSYFGITGPLINKISKNVEEIANTTQKIESDTTQLKSDIEDLKKEIKELPTEIKDGLVDEISANIVGQAFFTYETDTSNFPTITINFKQVGVKHHARISQIKFKLPMTSQAITDEFVNKLKQNFLLLTNLSYTYGRTRLLYLDKKIGFKNSIFVTQETEGMVVLKELCKALEINFDTTAVSITENSKRTLIGRRTTPLDGILVEPQSSFLPIQMRLFKSVLIVSGLQRPIVLFKGEIEV